MSGSGIRRTKPLSSTARISMSKLTSRHWSYVQAHR